MTVNHNHDPSYYPTPNHAGRVVHRTLEKKVRIEEELQLAEVSHALMLAHTSMFAIPQSIFERQDDFITRLWRIDISHNCVKVVPKEIMLCVNLRELWMSHNPIESFTYEIVKLPRLEVLDIKHTKIQVLPSEVIDLSNLIEFDWRQTPLEEYLQRDFGIPVNALETLQTVFRNINVRHKTREKLYQYLLGEHFIQDAYKSYAPQSIDALVDAVNEAFDVLEDFVAFTRRPSKYLPAGVDDIVQPAQHAAKAKEMFYDMKRETDRKRLAADVEIKIRALYFDRIERSEVVTLIDSIYECVHSLEDMQFLVQYAPKLFPPNVPQATGAAIWQNILDLQDDLIQKREASVVALSNALTQLYPEQKPETLLQSARDVAIFFQKERFATEKELLRMTQLTADVDKVFPPDFASLVPQEVVAAAFRQVFKTSS